MGRGWALLLVLLLPAVGLAKGSPIKSGKQLRSQLGRAAKKIVKKHLKLIKTLNKEQGEAAEWYVWVEAKSVDRLDPGNRKAKAYLEVEPPPPAKAIPGYVTARAQIDALAHKELGELMDRCEAGSLSQAEAEPLALVLVAYAPAHALGRRSLGFVGAPGRWLTPREESIQKAYAGAWKAVPTAKVLEKNPWPQLETDMGLKFTVHEGLHCYAAAVTGSVRVAELNTVIQSADIAYAAVHHDLLGASGLFSSPEKRPKATGFQPGRFHKPLFLLLNNNAQHLVYLANVVSDPKMTAGGKKIGFVTTVWRRKLVIGESWAPGRHIKEWPAGRMTKFAISMRFGQKRPNYVMQGLARYYSGHVSGQARVSLVSVGSQVRGEKKEKAGSFGQMRDLARTTFDTFRAAPPLAQGMFKTVESTTRRDNAIANAFVDYLLANDRSKLIQLLRVADMTEASLPDVIKTVFDDAAAVDAAFAKWLVKNY